MDALDPVLQGVTAKTAYALGDGLGHGAVVHGHYWGAAEHGFDCHAAEGFGEDGGRQQGTSVTEEIAAGGAANRPAILDIGMAPRRGVALAVEHDGPGTVVSKRLDGVDALEGGDAS